jgi:hypothetical protein
MSGRTAGGQKRMSKKANRTAHFSRADKTGQNHFSICLSRSPTPDRHGHTPIGVSVCPVFVRGRVTHHMGSTFDSPTRKPEAVA